MHSQRFKLLESLSIIKMSTSFSYQCLSNGARCLSQDRATIIYADTRSNKIIFLQDLIDPIPQNMVTEKLQDKMVEKSA